MAARPSVAIVGGGPAGLMTAIYLAKLQLHSKVIEQQPVAEITNRSFVYAINTRGLAALEQADIRLPGQEGVDTWTLNGVHRAAAVRIVRPGAKDTSAARSFPVKALHVERDALCRHLAEEAKRLRLDNIEILPAAKVEEFDVPSNSLTYTDQHGAKHTERFDLVIGADGVKSVVRASMLAADRGMETELVPNKRVYRSFRNLQPLHGEWSLLEEGKGSVLHFTSGQNQLLILWRDQLGTIGGALAGEEAVFAPLHTASDYEAFIRQHHAYLPQEWVGSIVSQLQEGKMARGGASLWCSTVRGPRVLLIGDAAHSCTPSMGQGANTALEDAVKLYEALKAEDCNVDAALARFEADRLPDYHALYELDRSALRRIGQGPLGKWDPEFFVFVFQQIFWSTLKKLFPNVRMPPLLRMNNEIVPFREVRQSLRTHKLVGGLIMGGILLFFLKWLLLQLGALSRSFLNKRLSFG